MASNRGDTGGKPTRSASLTEKMRSLDMLDTSTRALIHKCPLPMSPVDALEMWMEARRMGYSIKTFNKIMVAAFEDVTGVKFKDWI